MHPNKEWREYASKAQEILSSEFTSFLYNETIYKKHTSNVNRSRLKDSRTKYKFDEIIKSYRSNGLHLPSVIRKEIEATQKEVSALGIKFSNNIAKHMPSLTLSADELKGCPEDFISANQKGGAVEVRLVSSNVQAILQNCTIKDTREKVRELSLNYTHKPNRDILITYLNKQQKVAQLIGFKNSAERFTEDKMIETPKKAFEFIEHLETLTRGRVKKEIDAINRLKKSLNDKTPLTYADLDFYSYRITEKLLSFENNLLRPYFPYTHVKNTILNMFEEMFKIKFKVDRDARVWSDDAEAYLVESEGRVIGRIYLDMHPRDGKYTHACQTTMREGTKGKLLPQAILICNFNAPSKDSPGLQSLDEVSTFLHEFGHLIHTVLGGQESVWQDQSGTAVQRDFVEAPSQLLEELMLSKTILKRLSRHYKTSEPLPDELIEKILLQDQIISSGRLKGIGIARQASLSRLSLEAYTTNDITDEALLEIERRAFKNNLTVYGEYGMAYNFGHLDGYYSNYYTYMWSLAISKDLFTKFNKNNLLDTKVAEHYRKTILEPGGSKPAAELVKDFLGREWNMDAFKAYLKEGEELLANI